MIFYQFSSSGYNNKFFEEEQMRILLILLFLVALYNCLHLQGHMQSVNSVSILSNLQVSISNTNSQLLDLSKKNNLNLINEKDIDQKIKIVEAYLLQQRQTIQQLLILAQIDINNIQYTCPAQKQDQDEILSQFNSKYMGELKNFENILLTNSQRQYTTIGEQLKNSVTKVQKTSLPIQKGKYQLQQDSNLSFKNITNINSNLIVLGNEDEKQLTSQYYQTPSLICPYQNPFSTNSGQCINCPTQKPYFLVQNKTCIFCHSYNQVKKQCSDANGNLIIGSLFATNIDSSINQILLQQEESIDLYKNENDDLPLCPQDRPFFNGTKCISCPSGLYFLLKQKTCQTCPTGKFYSIYSHKCLIQYYFSNLDNFQWQTTSKQMDDILEDITIKRSDQNYASCPLDKPFSIDTSCIACDKECHFSYDTLTCVKCPSGTSLDFNMHKCLKPGNLNFQTNPSNTQNLIFNGRSQNQWMNIYYQNIQKYSGVVDCPIITPYFDGLSCILCPHSHPYFNLQTNVCQACEGTSIYEQSQHQCINSDDNRPVQTPTWQKMAARVFSN